MVYAQKITTYWMLIIGIGSNGLFTLFYSGAPK